MILMTIESRDRDGRIIHPARFLAGGGPVMKVCNREHYKKDCPKCGADPGEPCVYVNANYGIHRDPGTGRYVQSIAGEPMLKIHGERRRP